MDKIFKPFIISHNTRSSINDLKKGVNVNERLMKVKI